MQDLLLKSKIKVDPDLLEQVKTSVEERGQIILHCSLKLKTYLNYIRITKNCFLIDRDSDFSSQLIHAENIPFSPATKGIAPGEEAHFTLIFAGLPKTCKYIKYREVETAGFKPFLTDPIRRNKTDVYFIKMK